MLPTATDLVPNNLHMPLLPLANLAVHRYQDLIDLFNATFSMTYNTVLVKGGHEPIYIPATAEKMQHQIVFAHGYFASALHEIAHWCLAGEKRRLLEDYGYWYCPDGRNSEQQIEFEKVEIKPQAIEWAFSLAAKKSFKVSTDNLNGAPVDTAEFQQKVSHQAIYYLEKGFPVRAAQFIEVLQNFYQSEKLHWDMFHGK